MSDCTICDMISGETPSYSVYENDKTKALLDINPSVEGHTMVMHKRHGATVLDYTDDELKDIWITVKKVVRAIEETFGTNILSIGINHGEPGGIKHMHVHIIPRRIDDSGGVIQSLVRGNVVDALSIVERKLRSRIK